MTLEERSFNAGYLLAVSNLMNLHGSETEAVDVLRELGVKVDVLNDLDLGEYDAEPLRELFAIIAEHEEYDREKAAQKARAHAALEQSK